MSSFVTFDERQVRDHAPEILKALIGLTDAPIFDNDVIVAIGGLDPVSSRALLGANTAVYNATQPYLPFDHDDIKVPLI